MTETSASANKQIARAAGTVMGAFALSNLVGLLRNILILNVFGASAEMDAFNAANQVSDTLFNLVAGGALASSFIPTFTGLLVQGERRSAWRLAASIANWILLILTLASLLAALFAPQIVRYILAAGFTPGSEQERLAIDLVRLMMPAAVIFGLSGLVMGILNSHQVFLTPALTPSMYSLGLIMGAVVLAPSMGIYGLGWGVLAGASLHLALQLPALLRLKGHYFFTLGLDQPGVREVGRLLGPRMFGVAIIHLSAWVNVFLASFQQEGSLTAIRTAFALMLMPQIAIAQSVAIAAMPTLAAQYARGQLDEVRSSLAASLRGVLLLALPASLGLALLRRPLIIALYQRGSFDERATELVAWALLWYSAGLLGHSLVEVMARAFYALHDTKTPVAVGAATMALNVVLSIAFASLFTRVGWQPHGGLALANSLATALEMIGLFFFMRRRLNGLEERQVFAAALKAIAATALMAAALVVLLFYTASWQAWQILLAGLVVGIGVYTISVLALGVPEARSVLRFAWRKIRR